VDTSKAVTAPATPAAIGRSQDTVQRPQPRTDVLAGTAKVDGTPKTFNGQIGAPEPPTDGDAGSQRYGNQMQQAGGTQRSEIEAAGQISPGDQHAQGQTTVAYRARVPAKIGGQPSDVEGSVNQTIGANPTVTGAAVTLHNGPEGAAGTGVFVGVGRNAQVKTDITRDRSATASNVGSSWTFSPTVAKSIDGGSGRRLDLQAGASAVVGNAAVNAGRPAGAVYSGGAGFQMNQDLGHGWSVGAEGWAAGSVSNNGDTSARVGTGIGVQKTEGRLSGSLWLENQTEVGGGAKVTNTPSATVGVGLRFQ
jgi:hypothetical protein